MNVVFASNYSMYTDDGEEMLESTICSHTGLLATKQKEITSLEGLIKKGE